MSEHKHSPLPWSKQVSKSPIGVMDYMIQDDNLNYVACACTLNEAENAAFICRAVNSHYELIDALERLSVAYKLICEKTNMDFCESPSSVYANAQHTLKLAKEREAQGAMQNGVKSDWIEYDEKQGLPTPLKISDVDFKHINGCLHWNLKLTEGK